MPERANTAGIAESDLRGPTEARWPVALAVTIFLASTILIRTAVPHRDTLQPGWLVPTLEVVMLVLLVAADPASIGRRTRVLRPIAIALVFVLAAIAMISTSILIVDLIRGGPVTNAADDLLSSGALIWFGNCLVFSLMYWLLDSGGPLARYRRERLYPDFAFAQHQSPELAPPDWRPHYVDYLILGLTTNAAFSPTDVLPMARWAKSAMAVQSLVSLLLIGLVIARAVNVFT